MSIQPLAEPISIWDLGLNLNSGLSPTVAMTLLSASDLPTGTSSSGILGTAVNSVWNFSSTGSNLCSRSVSLSLSFLPSLICSSLGFLPFVWLLSSLRRRLKSSTCRSKSRRSLSNSNNFTISGLMPFCLDFSLTSFGLSLMN